MARRNTKALHMPLGPERAGLTLHRGALMVAAVAPGARAADCDNTRLQGCAAALAGKAAHAVQTINSGLRARWHPTQPRYAGWKELSISSRVLMRNEARISKLLAGCYSPCHCANSSMGKCCHGDDPKFTGVRTEWSHSLKVHL